MTAAAAAVPAPAPRQMLCDCCCCACALQGVEHAMAAARAAYEHHGAADKLQLYVVPGCAHDCTPCMWEQVRTVCCETGQSRRDL